jgi:uncharacterized membrane protein YfcA
VDLAAVLVMLPAVALAAPLGVWVAHRLDAPTLRRVFGGFLLLVAADMLHDWVAG